MGPDEVVPEEMNSTYKYASGVYEVREGVVLLCSFFCERSWRVG